MQTFDEDFIRFLVKHSQYRIILGELKELEYANYVVEQYKKIYTENGCLVNFSDAIYDFTYKRDFEKLTTFDRKESEIYKNIELCEEIMELDKTKFWFLILFQYDFCINVFRGKNKFFDYAESLDKEIEKFLSVIIDDSKPIDYDNCHNNPNYLMKLYNNQPAQLNLKIGDKNYTTEDRTTIGLIGLMCERIFNMYKEIQRNSPIEGDIIFKNLFIERSRPKGNVLPNSAATYMFCDGIKLCLDKYSKLKRAANANISDKEKELLSYLVYFTGLNVNPKLKDPITDEYNTIKSIMNKKNKPILINENINRIC